MYIHPIMLAVEFWAAVAAAGAVGTPHQTGRFTTRFSEYGPLSDTTSVAERLKVYVVPGTINKHHYAIEEESFEVYVPAAYEPNTPYGLLVWIAAGYSGGIEKYGGFRELMDKHKLIWVGANGSGNDANVCQRRIPLALDAAFNMPRLYTINPERIYVSGISGGGRVSSVAAFNYSDVYDGGIFVIGANYWKPSSVPGLDVVWRANSPKPQPEYLKLAKEHGRYVLLTGDTDGNRLQMHTYYEGLQKEVEHVLYIQVPKMGHQVPPPEEMDKALHYVDNTVPEEKSEESKN